MRICYLINQLAPGGAPTLLLDIIKNSKNNSYTVCYIEGDDAISNELQEAGADVVNFGADFKFDIRALTRMIIYFSQNEFDIIHAHLPYSQTLGRLFSVIGTTKAVVSTQHNVPVNYHPLTRFLEQITRGIDDATVAVSKDVEIAFRGEAHEFDGTLDRNWCTIYNGIDGNEFNQSVKSADTTHIDGDLDPDAFVFLNVARYVPAKSQELLIEAMASVVKTETNTHLFIVGWGRREEVLKRLVKEKNLEELVTVTGRVDSIYEYYKIADAFVSSSKYEGMPISYLEAMAAELPIVSTASPGVGEIVVNGSTGLLVPTGDSKKLANRMMTICDKTISEEMGKAGYERVAERFSILQTVRNYNTLYNLLQK